MALLFLDSFDHYVTADIGKKYLLTSINYDILPTGGRRGTQGLRIYSGSTWVAAMVGATGNTAIIGAALKLSSMPNGSPAYWGVRLGGTTQVYLSFTNTGYAQVWRAGSPNVLLGTALVGPVLPNVFYYVEMKVVIHPATGSAVVKINESTVLTVPSINTSASGTQTWNNVYLSGDGAQAHWDDFYVLDGSGATPVSAINCNDFLGDCRVDAKKPTAEGTTTQWVPLSGTDNALMVDDPTPDDDATYNQTDQIDKTDTFVVQDMVETGAVLYGVQLVMSQKKSDAGICSIAPVVRTGSPPEDNVGPPTNPGTTYVYRVVPYSMNPVTGQPWTQAEFNAAEFGYRRTA